MERRRIVVEEGPARFTLHVGERIVDSARVSEIAEAAAREALERPEGGAGGATRNT